MKEFNLTKILRVGDKVYSTILGDGIVESTNSVLPFPIRIMFDNGTSANFTAYGFFRENYGECILFPSKENRDWSKYHPVAQRYDFKPYDRILYWSHRDGQWIAGLFSHYASDTDNVVVTVGGNYYSSCIPYEGNEHLLGTNKTK